MSLGDYLSTPKINDLENGICIDINQIACVSCLYIHYCKYKDKDRHRSSFERWRDRNIAERDNK